MFSHESLLKVLSRTGILGEVGNMKVSPQDGAVGCTAWDCNSYGPVEALNDSFPTDTFILRYTKLSALVSFFKKLKDGRILLSPAQEKELRCKVCRCAKDQLTRNKNI